MKIIPAIVDGLIVQVNVVETSSEYTEGARASGPDLQDHEGYLFQYDIPQVLSFENTGVPFDLQVLYLTEVGEDIWIVMDEALLQKDSAKLASCFTPYSVVLELRRDFCAKNNIGIGSIINIYGDDEEDKS